MSKVKTSSVATVAFLLGVAGAGAGIYQAERSSYLAEQHAPPQRYENDVDAWAQQGTATPPAVNTTSRKGNAFTFGPRTGTRTLVLYGTGGEYGAQAESQATSAAQLASHFGPVTTLPLRDYRAGMVNSYDALLYLGVTYEPTLPDGLVHDVVSGRTPVVWAGANVEQLAGVSEQGTSKAQRARFVERYGWDPAASRPAVKDKLTSVEYRRTSLPRAFPRAQETVTVPHVVDASRAKIVATATCEKTCHAPDRVGSRSVPWAVRSGNLTYVGEAPFSFPVEGGHHLAYTDLLYGALGPNTPAVRQAAVRLEDVSPISDPERIREYADYLHSEGVPFQIAVVPNFVDRAGATLGGRPRNLTLADVPELVKALKYAQERGATLVQHGTTHQFAQVENPYSGASGDDFEFVRAACTPNASGTTYVTCEKDTHVQIVGPIGTDSADDVARRVAGGRALFREAGLDEPTLFETPHYAATENAYAGMRRVYDTRYERAQYADGVLSGTPSTGEAFDQIYPFRVHDIHGSTVLPENLGSVAPESYSGHAQRLPAEIVESARKNLVVRESTASFFYHPFLPLDGLKEIVAGIKGQGYTFVPATDLR